MDVESSDTIENIKKIIKNKEGIDPSQPMNFLFCGKFLLDNETIGTHYINHDSNILVFLKRNYNMKIFVKTLKGKTINLDVQSLDTIENIKDKINENMKILPEFQVLFFEGKELEEDDKNLEDYNIKSGSIIYLVLRLKGIINIMIKDIIGYTFKLKVESLGIIRNIKEKIKDKELIPIEQQILFLDGKQLDDEKILIDYNIKNKSNILLVQKEDKLLIFVEILSGIIIQFNIECLDTIKNIKEKIKDREGIPIEQQILFLDGKELEDNKTLFDYSVQKFIIPLDLSIKGVIKILFKMLTGKNFYLLVKSSDTLKETKIKIENKEKIPIEQQRLLFAGKELEDNKTFNDYNIKNEDTIHLALRLKGVMKILIKNINEKILNLDANYSNTIKDIKIKIKEKEGILPNHRYHLIFSGKKLEDNKTLEYYNIKDGTILYLVQVSLFPIMVQIRKETKIIIDVERSDTIKNIKEIIKEKEEIPIEQQRLLFNGKILEGDNCIWLYKIQNDSTIYLSRIIQLFVEIITGRTITLNVEQSNTIEYIKNKIKDYDDKDLNQYKLSISGMLLEDNKTLEYYNIKNQPTLHLIQVWIIKIIVLNLNIENFFIEVESSDTLKKLKKKIEDKQEILPNKYKLILNTGEKLEHNKTIGDYELNRNPIIYLVYDKNFEIFLLTPNEEVYNLNVEPSDKIINIKEKIKDKLDILPNQYKLIFNENELEEYKTLDDYNIKKEDIVYLVYCQFIQICVKTWIGSTFTLYVEASDTISNIKEKIQYRLGIFTNIQRLTIAGKPLEDNKTIVDYNIHKFDLVIHLNLRLRGGN